MVGSRSISSARRAVFENRAAKTSGKLKKEDLKKNRRNKVVSKKLSAAAEAGSQV